LGCAAARRLPGRTAPPPAPSPPPPALARILLDGLASSPPPHAPGARDGAPPGGVCEGASRAPSVASHRFAPPPRRVSGVGHVRHRAPCSPRGRGAPGLGWGCARRGQAFDAQSPQGAMSAAWGQGQRPRRWAQREPRAGEQRRRSAGRATQARCGGATRGAGLARPGQQEPAPRRPDRMPPRAACRGPAVLRGSVAGGAQRRRPRNMRHARRGPRLGGACEDSS